MGSGAIAVGLATLASSRAPVSMCARTDAALDRARQGVRAAARKFPDAQPDRVAFSCSTDVLAEATFVLEAIVEDRAAKCRLYGTLADALAPSALLATTTSSLPLTELAAASDREDRFLAFHPFNPVWRMPLVELAFPAAARVETRERGRALCAAWGKTAVEVPDSPGFVVNRLLFPYLYDAVRMLERTGIAPEAIDECMRAGAGHPMGPLALLDLVGLDVAVAIGRAIGLAPPRMLLALVHEGALGRKTKRGFYSYG